MEKIQQLDGLPAIDLDREPVLERGAIYVIELFEAVSLSAELTGIANPKSSTGRPDILTRLIADRAIAFDRVEPGYRGPLYLEVAPLTFSVVVRPGVRLSQLRLQRGIGPMPQVEIDKLRERAADRLSRSAPGPLRDGLLVPVTVDLEGAGPGAAIGYKAKKSANKIDVDLISHYDPREFWDRIESGGGRLNLDQGDFYILATREDVGVPPQLAAEMVPYDARSGEFRVHYAGFFDPGFGFVDDKAAGSKAVLEVRSYGVSFSLEDGQIVGWLRYSPLAGGPDRTIVRSGCKIQLPGAGRHAIETVQDMGRLAPVASWRNAQWARPRFARARSSPALLTPRQVFQPDRREMIGSGRGIGFYRRFTDAVQYFQCLAAQFTAACNWAARAEASVGRRRPYQFLLASFLQVSSLVRSSSRGS